ncbi:MAG: histone deacetylase [Anaerolineae bacterium]|nr:histone deacetylase [Anaerolineae bacterium]
MTTAYLINARQHEHTLQGHPENAQRLAAIADVFATSGVLKHLRSLTAPPASDEQLLRVHTPAYLDLLGKITSTEQLALFGTDTYVLPASFEVARLAAGVVLRAVDAVLGGEATNALVAARPPGHHALADTAMGFCLLANVALAARHAQAAYGVKRVLIVDYDVHHGNGTQDIFYDDPTVCYMSTHQSPFYPGTGALDETGQDAGTGATLNVPLRAGYGDDDFARIYGRVLWPLVWRFQPELILVSAGFDCHWNDPIGGMRVTLDGYATLTRELIEMAHDVCDGRIVFVLEGGYSLDAVAHGMLNIAYALLREPTVSDPLGPPPESRRPRLSLPPVDAVLDRVCAVHGLD